MSELSLGTEVRLVKFPPNRSMMDWDRILQLGQFGRLVETNADKRGTLYLVWFTSKDGREGWDVWLTREHFKPTYE